MKKYTIAVIGNPNCGKTSLFNLLTGGHQTTGNWPGVTVEKLHGRYSYNSNEYNLVDLPGIYSLSAFSEDERITREYLLSGEADLVINIIDASNLERNLFLTTHLIEMGIPFIPILNKRDLAERNGIELDSENFASLIGIPTIYGSVHDNSFSNVIKSQIAKMVDSAPKSPITITYENEIATQIESIRATLQKDTDIPSEDLHWSAVKLLEGDRPLKKKLSSEGKYPEEELKKAHDLIESTLNEETSVLIADARYATIHGIASSCIKVQKTRRSITDRIDMFALNPIFGLPLFFLVMYLTFWTTITLGEAFIEFFEEIAEALFVDGPGHLLESIGAPEVLTHIITDGIGTGLVTLAEFIPIIFILFFVLSLLEDSGYMARAAFTMDKFMRKIGLPGKAFVPLLVGFGCTVPAILATRTLENKKDRFLSIFMAPFMSCGARLPVYALFAVSVFPGRGQQVLFSLYMVGILMAVLTGFFLKNTLFKGEYTPFVMELPPYHAPRLKHIFIHTWIRLKGFVVGAGRILIIVLAILGILNSLGTDGSWGNEDSETSILSNIGRATTPLFTSFGVTEENWPASVGLFTGIFAKEVIVGTLSSLYGAEEEDCCDSDEEYSFWGHIGEAFTNLPGDILAAFGIGVDEDDEFDEPFTHAISSHFQTWQAAYAYLLFVLLYVPCLVAVAASIKEIGLSLALFQVVYSTVLAWITATLFYQITVGHSIATIALALIVSVVFGFSVHHYSKKHPCTE